MYKYVHTSYVGIRRYLLLFYKHSARCAVYLVLKSYGEVGYPVSVNLLKLRSCVDILPIGIQQSRTHSTLS